MEKDFTLDDFDKINRELFGGRMSEYDLTMAYRIYAEKKQKERREKAA